MVRESALETNRSLDENEINTDSENAGFVMVDSAQGQNAEQTATLSWPKRISAARLFMDEGQFGDARRMLLNALQVKPNDPLCRAMLAHCTAAVEGDSVESLPMCEAAAREARRPEILYHLGSIHLIQGNRRKAVQVFHDGLALDPRHVPILAQLEKIGRRKPPVLRFLSRDNTLNMRLGRLLTRMGKR